jgi:hypothetical protein
MPNAAKIRGVDDEADFEALIRQRFRRQIREGSSLSALPIMARKP